MINYISEWYAVKLDLFKLYDRVAITFVKRNGLHFVSNRKTGQDMNIEQLMVYEEYQRLVNNIEELDRMGETTWYGVGREIDFVEIDGSRYLRCTIPRTNFSPKLLLIPNKKI